MQHEHKRAGVLRRRLMWLIMPFLRWRMRTMYRVHPMLWHHEAGDVEGACIHAYCIGHRYNRRATAAYEHDPRIAALTKSRTFVELINEILSRQGGGLGLIFPEIVDWKPAIHYIAAAVYVTWDNPGVRRFVDDVPSLVEESVGRHEVKALLANEDWLASGIPAIGAFVGDGMSPATVGCFMGSLIALFDDKKNYEELHRVVDPAVSTGAAILDRAFDVDEVGGFFNA